MPGTRGCAPSEGIMNESNPATTFRGLPLTPEQDSEIRHYIHVKERSGAPWDTPELRAMLADMLDPPQLFEEDGLSLGQSIEGEQATASEEDAQDDSATAPHEHGARGAH
jgi:hypothetical protein